ncbi:NACHT domain-containing protein [Actinokineospora sp. G85]|uniref:NACHT domain-containing protein n=1 Tax=Actinokineospora sp. G85 TaxID=3406626 RepID=UPI003C77E9A7
MPQDDPLTYEGALRILGRNDPAWVKRFDLGFGAVILGAGALSLVAPAAAAALFGVLWASVDQKNELLRLVREGVDAVRDRKRQVTGPQRRELVASAHTVLVMTALLESLADRNSETGKGELSRSFQDSGVAPLLLRSEIPAPGIDAGFVENLGRIREWALERKWPFDAPMELVDFQELGHATVARYETLYTDLARDVPEFRIWAELGEHAATRAALADLQDDVTVALDSAGGTMARVEGLLKLFVPATAVTSQRETVWRANRSVLDEWVIPRATAQRYSDHLVFPTTDAAFISPHYRFALTRRESRIADDRWWDERPLRDNLDLALVAHLTSPSAVRVPLLVLGHPGAGKSLLTKVVTARLPAESYTAVRVPLRRVSGTSPVYQQIQEFLDEATHDRVEWSRLVDEHSAETTRVVILDGLDELLQKPDAQLYGYLRSVVDFQRREREQERPVAVIVTSRTLVSDRVDIPEGTPVVRLEDFDDAQIERWLRVWHETNAAGIATGKVQEFPLAKALEQKDLTAQPLLLLMMALYFADPEVAFLDEEITAAELYGRLLKHFAEREADKANRLLTEGERAAAVEDHLHRLSTAALGMINRGRQDITARQVREDLAALGGASTQDVGERVLGEFFFVYASEARLAPGDPDRQYEFLHATFGEYLVASRVLDELVDVAVKANAGRGSDPVDDLLRAMLCHESLAVRRPVLTFLRDLGARLEPDQLNQVLRVLDSLIADHRTRPVSVRHSDYRPRAVDHVRQFAAYSANLVLARVALGIDDPLRPAELLPDATEPLGRWGSLLALWEAGLDKASYRATLAALEPTGNDIVLGPESNRDVRAFVQRARLNGDRVHERRLRYGSAFVDNSYWNFNGDHGGDVLHPWLIRVLVAPSKEEFGPLLSVLDRLGADERRSLLDSVEAVLLTRAESIHPVWLSSLVEMYLDTTDTPNAVAVASAVCANRALFTRNPKVRAVLRDGGLRVELMLRAQWFRLPATAAHLDRIIDRDSLGAVDSRVIRAITDLLAAYRR